MTTSRCPPAIFLLVAAIAAAGAGLAPAAALTEAQAVAAVERFMVAWNTRDPQAFAATLHYPHVRPSPGGGGEVYATAEEYAATIDFARVAATGWVRSALDSTRVVHLGAGKAHVAGRYARFRADGSRIFTTQVTYVVTERSGSIGIQARFAAGPVLESKEEREAAASAAVAVVEAYMAAFNARDEEAWVSTFHYPHLRLAGGEVRSWPNGDAYREAFDFDEFAKRLGWQASVWDSIEPVQVAKDGVVVALRATRRDAAGAAISTFDTLYLVTREDGGWGVRARSSFAE
ncbi:MAG TPA: hypothetical protein VMS86_04505 [Thermoanaerobaculia bacterium]|nr:hypothetical protein [Thermoanaerobaculia bacterium]